MFRNQLEALDAAKLLIQKLPAHAVWSLSVTEDDDYESPTVFNVFAEEEDWPKLMVSLRLGKPVDRSTDEKGDQFLVFRQGTLLISFIEQGV